MDDSYHTILVKKGRGACFITLNRPQAGNSINETMIKELQAVFGQIEQDTAVKVVILQGSDQHFCTGMDFNVIADNDLETVSDEIQHGYYNLLKHMTICSKVFIAKVDGKANAGGIGFVAASDIVIASNQAKFSLSEALFGLLPACVMPFLIKRVGLQKAQWLTLMTQAISAQRAYEINLVDELSENTAETLRLALLRLTRLETSTVLDLKKYMAKLWIIDETTQQLAVDKTTSLLRSDKVRQNIKNFIEKGIFPWNK